MRRVKKYLYSLILLLGLLVLTACSSGIRDGVYRSEEGYTLTVSGKDIELNTLIATGRGTIKGNAIDIETSILGFSSGNQLMPFKVKGKTIEVTDENGNVMMFEPLAYGEEAGAAGAVGELIGSVVYNVTERVESEASLDGTYQHEDGFLVTLSEKEVEFIGWPFEQAIEKLSNQFRTKLDYPESSSDFRWLYYSKGTLSGNQIELAKPFTLGGKKPKLSLEKIENGIVITDQAGVEYYYYNSTDD